MIRPFVVPQPHFTPVPPRTLSIPATTNPVKLTSTSYFLMVLNVVCSNCSICPQYHFPTHPKPTLDPFVLLPSSYTPPQQSGPSLPVSSPSFLWLSTHPVSQIQRLYHNELQLLIHLVYLPPSPDCNLPKTRDCTLVISIFRHLE